MRNVGQINKADTVFLIIDLQEKLMPVISNKEEVFSNVNKLISGAKVLSIPVIVTEQYSRGLGHTCKEVQLSSDQLVIEKMCFSSMLSEEILEKLKEMNIKSLILAGVESHICVLKTALDALARGYEVHVVVDAVSSRKVIDKEVALSRIRQVGGYIVTTEMILFQLIDFAGTDEFKQISKIVK